MIGTRVKSRPVKLDMPNIFDVKTNTDAKNLPDVNLLKMLQGGTCSPSKVCSRLSKNKLTSSAVTQARDGFIFAAAVVFHDVRFLKFRTQSSPGVLFLKCVETSPRASSRSFTITLISVLPTGKFQSASLFKTPARISSSLFFKAVGRP